MRAVVYARYSSDLQRDASIEDQVRLCREHVSRLGWTYLHAYTDRAMSGASALRPGYQKLLEDARAGRFDIVVAEALDRLSRDQEDIAGLYKQLTFSSVRIVTLAEGDVSELHVGLKGTMNALFLKDLAAKIRRGMDGRVRAARSAGGKAYGYEVVRELSSNGELVRGGRTINPTEAAVVRRIFQEFAKGSSSLAIAKGLNNDCIPSPSGKRWGKSTLRGHHKAGNGLLRNELYVGRLVWNRQRFVRDPDTGKRVPRLNPQSDWVIQEVPDLRIVDDELWQKVKERLKEAYDSPASHKVRASGFWLLRRPKHLLSGLVRCGACGGTFAAVGRHYLACANARGKGTCTNRRAIPRHSLEDLILDGLKDRLMAPELVEEFVRAFQVEVNRRRREHDLGRENLKREFGKVSRQLEKLIEAIADGLSTKGLKARLEGLEARKVEIEQAITETPSPAPRLHPNLATLYRTKVQDLRNALVDSDTHDEALEILRGLIREIRVSPTEEGLEIELVGNIAHLLDLAAPTHRVLGKFASSVKVVAEEGFEPPTKGL